MNHRPIPTGQLTVKALAKATGVTTDTIRHYDQIGLLQPRRDPDNAYRYFSESDIQKVRFVRQAKLLGYTLVEIQKIIEHSERGISPCPLVREIIQQRIVENHQRLNEMLDMQTHMEQALQQWAQLPDGIPDGNQICRLIESAS